MVKYLMTPMVHASYDTRNSINCGNVYFVLGGVSPGRELPCGPGLSPRGGGVTVHDWWPQQILHGFLSEVSRGHA